MKSKVHLAILAIRISTVIYALLALVFVVLTFVLPTDTDGWSPFMGYFMAAILVPFIVFLEILITALRKRRFWAWIAGLIVASMYVPSLFLPLGIMLFIGLLSNESRSEFGVGNKTTSPASTPESN